MYIIRGKVIRGEGYGKQLGFPTANLDRRHFSRLKVKPKLGIWAGRARILTTHYSLPTINYKAAIVIGPKDKNGLPKIEAHLIGFKGNLYGKKLTLDVVKYLRPFKKYRNERELIVQIRKDVASVKKYA